MGFDTFSEDQAKTVINANQIFEALEDARNNAKRYEGSMHFKKVKDGEYLYRGFTGGKAASLGPKSEQTIAIKAKFDEDKKEAKERVKGLEDKVRMHSGFIRAVKLNRFPVAAARVIRALNQKNIPHRIIGTNALYAYEQGGGILFEPDHIATADIDVLMDARQSVKIATNLGRRSLLELLKKTDKSFKRMSASDLEFAATNSDGYRVDFLTQLVDPFSEGVFEQVLEQNQLVPVEIDSLKWQISAPYYTQVVYDTSGFPVKVNTVDPRAFVLHKWFASKQPDREPIKKIRDESQARIVATLLKQGRFGLEPSKAIERIFPQHVQQQANEDGLEF